MYKGLRKCEFFTAWNIRGNVTAEKQCGYYDNYYYYYKNVFNHWHAIEPLSGLSVASADLLRDCMRDALTVDDLRLQIAKNSAFYWKTAQLFRASENKKAGV